MTYVLRDTVSVIVPTRDRREGVCRALASVLDQTHPPDEVIVVDDGSSDDTAGMVRRAFPAVRCVTQAPAGVSAARNRGVALATGRWIAFLDSDDEWRPAKLERQLEVLSRNRDAVVCHSDEIWIRNGRRVNPRRRHEKAGGWIFSRCLPICAMSPSSVLMRRAVFDAVGRFDEGLPVCEDYDLWLRLCSRYEVAYVDEPLVVKYGGHADQLSRRYTGMDRYRVLALERIIASGVLGPGDLDAARRTLVEKARIYGEGARKRGRDDEAIVFDAKIRRHSTQVTKG